MGGFNCRMPTYARKSGAAAAKHAARAWSWHNERLCQAPVGLVRRPRLPCPPAPSAPGAHHVQPRVSQLISTANITMQFGAKPLFENISVKFGDGNRYGLIGANGCGKSTFMKILGGDLEPPSSAGQVMLEPNVRLGKLRQDQFAYEDFSVLDTVIMGHAELWEVKAERDRIYALPEMSEEDGYGRGRAGSPVRRVRRLHRRSARRRAAAGRGHSGGTALRPDERRRAGLEAARAAGPGAVLQPGHPAARRTDQQPGHQHHPLAGADGPHERATAP